MKREIKWLFITAICLGLAWAIYVAAAPVGPPLSKFIPSGSMLYLQASDFSSLLAQWNSSTEKKQWLKSSNYEMFSRTRLFLRLKGASDQFAAAAGLPADMKFVAQVAGSESVLAIYDIGKLQFLYITRLSSASSMQSDLWQTRAKFETRSASGMTFYVRHDPESERVVAFGAAGDYLLLATREDLLAGALQLIAGSKDRTIESDSWWAESVAAAGPEGDLRLVLNLEKIVPSPYFRTYWVQQNITDMKQYGSSVSDMFLARGESREERVLLRKSGQSMQAPEGAKEVPELASVVGADVGFYEAKANPSADECFSILETKLLAPHAGSAPPSHFAPQIQLTNGETGASADLETRIDQAPAHSAPTDRSAEIKNLFSNNQVVAMAEAQSTDRDKDGVFVRLHSTIIYEGSTDWNDTNVRAALSSFVGPDLTASQLGTAWHELSGVHALDGLWTLSTAVRGKYLLITDDPQGLRATVARLNEKNNTKPAVFMSGFKHDRERGNFALLAGLVDRPNFQAGADNREPQFLSDNIASLSSVLSGVSSENIVVRDAGDKVLETVTYEWSQ